MGIWVMWDFMPHFGANNWLCHPTALAQFSSLSVGVFFWYLKKSWESPSIPSPYYPIIKFKYYKHNYNGENKKLQQISERKSIPKLIHREEEKKIYFLQKMSWNGFSAKDSFQKNQISVGFQHDVLKMEI